MNRPYRTLAFLFVPSLALFVAISFAGGIFAQEKNASGEAFFIIASVDQTKSQLLLKRPTEVTVLMTITDKTQFVDEKTRPIHLADLRAGDTVWVTSSITAGEATAVRIRGGAMTVTDLHRLYLDYPEIN